MMNRSCAREKRRYCAWCGRVISTLSHVFQDEDGRVFRFHRVCHQAAKKYRKRMEEELETMRK